MISLLEAELCLFAHSMDEDGLVVFGLARLLFPGILSEIYVFWHEGGNEPFVASDRLKKCGCDSLLVSYQLHHFMSGPV